VKRNSFYIYGSTTQVGYIMKQVDNPSGAFHPSDAPVTENPAPSQARHPVLQINKSKAIVRASTEASATGAALIFTPCAWKTQVFHVILSL
jgi:hypothetical protein